jgi:hypothetical protein
MNDLRVTRLQIMLSLEELQALDDFRFTRRRASPETTVSNNQGLSGGSEMTKTQRAGVGPAPVDHRRELTREEVRRELLRAHAIQSQSRALLADDLEAASESMSFSSRAAKQ